MPLVKGKKASSPKGFSENIRREYREGKPLKQSVAIAYSEADIGKKKKKSKMSTPHDVNSGKMKKTMKQDKYR